MNPSYDTIEKLEGTVLFVKGQGMNSLKYTLNQDAKYVYNKLWLKQFKSTLYKDYYPILTFFFYRLTFNKIWPII